MIWPAPTRIEPIFVPRIWGARSLAPLFPEKSNLQEPIGEAWLTGVDCRVASGPFTGKTLRTAWAEMPVDWRGSQLAAEVNFPLLVKFIFPMEKLSIQVHPDDAYASTHEQAAGGRGKTEMWHIVSAEPGARVLVGLNSGVDQRTFREALSTNTLEALFQSHEVQAGDTIFVPAGTPHTIGPGMIICEVQEYSDLTYRVYDYGRVDVHGRPRDLHIEKALAVMNFDARNSGKVNTLPLPSHDAFKFLLAACRFFAVEHWEFEWKFEAKCDPSHFDLFVILEGKGSLEWDGGEAPCERGECWLIPASLTALTVTTSEPTKLLRVYVPDLSKLRSELEGIPERAIARVLFD